MSEDERYTPEGLVARFRELENVELKLEQSRKEVFSSSQLHRQEILEHSRTKTKRDELQRRVEFLENQVVELKSEVEAHIRKNRELSDELKGVRAMAASASTRSSWEDRKTEPIFSGPITADHLNIARSSSHHVGLGLSVPPTKPTCKLLGKTLDKWAITGEVVNSLSKIGLRNDATIFQSWAAEASYAAVLAEADRLCQVY